MSVLALSLFTVYTATKLTRAFTIFIHRGRTTKTIFGTRVLLVFLTKNFPSSHLTQIRLFVSLSLLRRPYSEYTANFRISAENRTNLESTAGSAL